MGFSNEFACDGADGVHGGVAVGGWERRMEGEEKGGEDVPGRGSSKLGELWQEVKGTLRG